MNGSKLNSQPAGCTPPRPEKPGDAGEPGTPFNRIEMRHKNIFVLSILLIMSPHAAYATEPTGIFDVLWGFIIVFLCFVVIPITLVGFALRNKPSENNDRFETQSSQMSSETPAAIEFKEASIEENKETATLQRKPRLSLMRCILIILAVVIAIGPFVPEDIVVLKLPYTILFLAILYGFPVLIPVALLSLFLAARRRKFNNKQPPV